MKKFPLIKIVREKTFLKTIFNNVCTKAVWAAGVSELVNESAAKYVNLSIS